jgi:histidine triad (HIT) family protein
MEDCLFCKIIRGEIPSYKIYEDEDVLAFLDIHPAAEGHTLVIPKKHYTDIFEMDSGTIEKIAAVAKIVAQKMKDNLNVSAVNLYHASGTAAEQTVFHAHLHIIPRKKGDNISFTAAAEGKQALTEEQFKEILSKLKTGR